MESPEPNFTPGTFPTTQDPLEQPGQLDDFHMLSHAVRNERSTQDILEFKHDLVSRLEQQLEDKGAQVEDLLKDPQQQIPRLVYHLNSTRFRYLLKAYYRARLAKLEKFATAILDEPELQQRCSQPELKYCMDYFVATGRCLKEVVLQHLPEEFQTLVQESQLTEAKDMIPRPKLDGYTFVKLLQDAGHVAVDDEGVQLVDMRSGDIFILKYNCVQRLVRQEIGVLV